MRHNANVYRLIGGAGVCSGGGVSFDRHGQYASWHWRFAIATESGAVEGSE